MTRSSLELLALLSGSVLIFVTNISMLGPLLLQLATELEVHLAQAGLLVSAASLPWALAAPFMGPLSDRFGRRATLAVSLSTLGAATVMSAAANGFGVLLAMRVGCGLLASAGPPSLLASVGDLFPPRRRAWAAGWVNAGFGFAALVGVPVVAAIGGAFGWRWAFVATGLATIALAALIWWRLPGRGGRTAATVGVAAAYRQVLRSSGLAPVLAANLLERSVFGAVTIYLAAYLLQSYGLDLLELAPILAIAAIGTIGGNLLGGWLADRGSKSSVFAIGQLGAAIFGLAFFVTQPGLLVSIALIVAYGLMTSASRPAIIAMASTISTEHRGTAFGFFSATNQGGWAIGPAAAALAFVLGGYPAIGVFSGVASIAAAVVMILFLGRSRSSMLAERDG